MRSVSSGTRKPEVYGTGTDRPEVCGYWRSLLYLHTGRRSLSPPPAASKRPQRFEDAASRFDGLATINGPLC